MATLYFWALLATAFQVGGECPSALERAQRAYKDRKLEAAIAGFERAIAACPPNAGLHVTLGQLLYLGGKEAEAEKRILEGLAVEPNQTEALYALGRIYYEQKRYPDAVKRLNQVVTLDPKHYKAWDNLGLCFDALRQDNDALRHFFKALDLVMKDHPEYDWAHANLADFFLRREQYEKAFQLAAEAARRNPASARNALITGKALARLEKPDLALRWLEQAVKLDPKLREGWYLLGQLYRKLERPEDAARALEKVKQLPASPTR